MTDQTKQACESLVTSVELLMDILRGCACDWADPRFQQVREEVAEAKKLLAEPPKQIPVGAGDGNTYVVLDAPLRK